MKNVTCEIVGDTIITPGVLFCGLKIIARHGAFKRLAGDLS